MKDEDVRRYLDGGRKVDALDDPARSEAGSWERLLAAFRAEAPGAPAPPWLEDRVMAEIEALPEPGPARRAWSWLLRPRPVRLSPATLGLAAAAVFALVLLSGRRGPTPAAHPVGAGATVVYVQFDLRAPTARSVAVGGDFDEWQGSYPLEDPDGDGVWTGRVPVRPGLYAYMFLVNGSKWVTDPEATHYTDDGFGNRNAVLAVAAPAT
jgi:hypothetical protein